MTRQTDPKKSSKSNLFAQFFSRLLIPILLTFLLASLGTAYIGYNTRQKESLQYRKQTIQSFSRSFSKPLWDCDNSTAQGILDALVNQPAVIKGSVEELCQGQTLTAGIELTGAETGLVEKSGIRYRDELDREYELGTLKVTFQKPSASGTIFEVFWQYFVLFTLLLMVLLLSTLKIFQRLISIPLARFQTAINKSGDSSAGMLLLDNEIRKRNDELGDVMIAFNDLMHELSDVIAKLRQNEAVLSEMARKDPLTGLGNRLVLEEEFTRALARSKRSGQSGCVLLFDLDGFKPINDIHGHAVGDMVLQQTAQRIKSVVRSTDTVVRIGGDEFVVIAENMADRDTTANLAHKLMEAVSEPICYQNQTLKIGVSIGVALFPEDGVSSTTLLAKADRKMYEVKRAHKNGS